MNDKTTHINFINIVDSTEKNHYKHVHSLISDNGGHSIIPKLSKDHVHSIPVEEKRVTISTIGDIQSILYYNKYSFINMSVDWTAENIDKRYTMKNTLQYAASKKSIIVIASGNIDDENTLRLCSQADLSSNFPAGECFVDNVINAVAQTLNPVLVGSLSPRTGQPSIFSKKSSAVSILAPSGKSLTSADDGNYVKFGGTSGATALVTGSLAAFEWLSGYHPTSEEAKILLERTAIPTQSSKCGGLHGKGLLNTYRLGQVGMRLKEECEKDEKQCFQQCEKNTDAKLCREQKCNKQECFKNKIQSDIAYQFDFDPKEYEGIKAKFPECDENIPILTNKITPCSKKQEAFKKLRKAALLHPLKKELWNTLSCIYEKNGFTQNARMLRNINNQMHQECPE